MRTVVVVMSQQPPAVHGVPKGVNSPTSLSPSASPAIASSPCAGDNSSQRRSGGASPRHSLASARNTQSERKRHKDRRRPGLATDDDAIAESVSYASFPKAEREGRDREGGWAELAD